MKLWLAAAVVLATSGQAVAFDGASVETHQVKPRRSAGSLEVIVTVKNDNAYLANVMVSCGLYKNDEASGSVSGIVEAIPPHKSVVGSIAGFAEGDRAECRPTEVSKSD
jgi:hypothetical protein